MQIGELFLNLGIKGTDKAVGSIDSVNKSLSETAHISLGAKAAIVGAIYELEQLFKTSGQAGTGLSNINATLGVSTKTLQQYQYAARQVGASNEDVTATFKSLQEQMTETLTHGKAPATVAQLAYLTPEFGEFGAKEQQRYLAHPEELFQRLQAYAQKEKNAGVRNQTLRGFGLSESIISGLTRNAFTQQQFAKAPTYSDREISQLDKANIAWSNLGTKIEMAIGHFNAMHGGQLVNDISSIVTQVVKLSDAFIKLSDTLHLFKGISLLFSGIEHTLEGITQAVKILTTGNVFGGGSVFDRNKLTPALSGQNILSQASKALQPIAIPTAELAAALGSILGFGGEKVTNNAIHSVANNTTNNITNHSAGVVTPQAVAPKVSPGLAQGGNTQNIEVNQNLNFQHEGKDSKQTGDSVRDAVINAYRQMSAQSQGA